MKTKERLEQLKKQFERLRRESMEAVGTANEILYSALHRFTDKELKALTDYYDAALASIKSSKKSGDLKQAVQTQFDLMQETVTRLITHARESLEAIAEARVEPKAGKSGAKPGPKATAKSAASKKAAKKSSASAAKTASKTAKTPRKKAAKKAPPADQAPLQLADSTSPPKSNNIA